MTYNFYTELLTKTIRGTITPAERTKVSFYETQHPDVVCPHCRRRTRSILPPSRVTHAVEECDMKKKKHEKP